MLKARDTWPRTAKVFCHPATEWPDDPQIVERVPVRSCVRRGPAIEEWTYRFLGAALAELATHDRADELASRLVEAGALPHPEPATAAVRAWAVANGLPVSDRGRLRPEILDALAAAHPG